MDEPLVVDALTVNPGRYTTMEELSVERLPKEEVGEISQKTLDTLYIRMTEEVFNKLGVDVASNIICFKACVRHISRSGLLTATKLSAWGGYRTMANDIAVAVRIYRKTGKACVIPAPKLVGFWAAVNIRRARSDGKGELWRGLNQLEMYRHVVTAIYIFPKHQNHFLVDVRPVTEPRITGENLRGFPVVHAPIALSEIREVIPVLGIPGGMDANNDSIEHYVSSQLSANEIKRVSPVGQYANPPPLKKTCTSTRRTDSDPQLETNAIMIQTQITRAEAMARAGDIFTKLEYPLRFANQDLKPQIEAWISEERIQLLNATNRNRLWVWCDKHLKEWADKIRALPESYPETIQCGKQQKEPRGWHQQKVNLEQKLEILSNIANDLEAVRKWILYVKPVAEVDKTLQSIQDELATLREAVAQLQTTATTTKMTSENMDWKMAGFHPSPLNRQRHEIKSERENKGLLEIPQAQYKDFLHFFRVLHADLSHPRGIKWEVSKLCDSLGASKRQKKQLLKVLDKKKKRQRR